MNTIVFISIAVMIASVFFAIVLNRKAKPVSAAEKPVHFFKASINYRVSSMVSANGIDYTLINVGLTNNYDHTLEGVTIQTIPYSQPVQEIIVANANKVADAFAHPIHYQSITNNAINIAAGATISGYIILKSYNDACPVDELKVMTKTDTITLHIQKDKIQRESTGNRVM